MTKTVIEKLASSSPEVAVFKVGGTLGYHEKQTLEKFFNECEKREICKIVLDFSSLSSLGGGCAGIIRKYASLGELSLSIVGASQTVLKFLDSKSAGQDIIFVSSVDEAVEKLKGIILSETFSSNIQNDIKEQKESPAGNHFPSSNQGDIPQVIILGDGSGGNPNNEVHGDAQNSIEEETGPPKSKDSAKASSSDQDSQETSKDSAHLSLKKKLVHYSALLTISSDFNRLEDRSSLLDAFLLTTIAQIGVESAAFFEAKDDAFIHAASKGVDDTEAVFPVVPISGIDKNVWNEDIDSYEISRLPFDQAAKDGLQACGFRFAAPLIIQEMIKGIVLLGPPIKRKLDGERLEFLKVLLSQAAISYEKTKRMEEESERTLGLVQTLITLIEENTMGKGNTDMVSNYSYATAVKMNYPKEFLKDLMFGTVLRDIGMIKVSDLIVRSPRELAKEEWEIIKRHPKDGAEMLKEMKFSKHTTDIVLFHHERFNGEGYPKGLEGGGIPLGAKIVSVVESYAAMLRDRPSRPALKQDEAMNTLKENWGMRYDSEVVNCFLEVINEEINSGQKAQYSHKELFKI